MRYLSVVLNDQESNTCGTFLASHHASHLASHLASPPLRDFSGKTKNCSPSPSIKSVCNPSAVLNDQVSEEIFRLFCLTEKEVEIEQ
jgi:hypothetical protein